MEEHPCKRDQKWCGEEARPRHWSTSAEAVMENLGTPLVRSFALAYHTLAGECLP